MTDPEALGKAKKLYATAVDYFNKGNYAEAAKLFREALAIFVALEETQLDQAKTIEYLGDCMLFLGNLEKAET